MYASLENYFKIVEFLINSGADVNMQDVNGLTALMFAVIRGHLESVNLLLDVGADINLRDKYGETALFKSAKYGQADAAAEDIQE
jgi:ankyrin repeat protein